MRNDVKYLAPKRACLLDLKEQQPKGSIFTFKGISLRVQRDETGTAHLENGCTELESELDLVSLEVFFDTGCKACLEEATEVNFFRVTPMEMLEAKNNTQVKINLAQADIRTVLDELLDLDRKVRTAEALNPSGEIEAFKALAELHVDFHSENILGFYLGPESVLGWLSVFQDAIAKKSDEILKILLEGEQSEVERLYAAELSPDDASNQERQFFLVDFGNSRLTELWTLEQLYGLGLNGGRRVVHISEVLLKGLEKRGLKVGQSSKVEVKEILEPSTVEALKALYKPEGGKSGVYHLLDQAYLAAEQL